MYKFGVSRTTKIIVFSQAVLLTFFLVFMTFIVPKLDYPFNGAVLNGDGVSFSFKHANVILLDDNEDFSSPKKINASDLQIGRVLFEPGTYYWKAVGVVESSPKMFIVPSTVGLEYDSNNSTIRNVGDVDLEIETKGTSSATGLVILEINTERVVEDKAIVNFKGEQI